MEALIQFLQRVPGIVGKIGRGYYDNGNWWVKFGIEITRPLAWNVVQEFGCVLNYISINERLPTRFYPVSPAPYLNGGPRDFLSWIIESTDCSFKPETCAEWLEGRLPRPIDDATAWPKDEPGWRDYHGD